MYRNMWVILAYPHLVDQILNAKFKVNHHHALASLNLSDHHQTVGQNVSLTVSAHTIWLAQT